MPEKKQWEKDVQISLRVSPKTHEDFSFICFMKKTKMAIEIKKFITQFIKDNIEILKYDDTHIQILVETEDGVRKWTSVTEEERDRDYENIGTEGKALFKKKR